MRVLGHAVRRTGPLQRGENPGAVEADVEVDGAGRLEQTVEMIVDKGPFTVVEAHALPDAVAEEETRIVDRDRRLRLRHDPAVDIDQDILISRIDFRVVGGNLLRDLGFDQDGSPR